jgi:uncharacterized protein YjiS (DUF1127 family)
VFTSLPLETSRCGQAHLLVIPDEEKAMPTFELMLPPRAYSTWRAARSPTRPAAAAWTLIAGWIDRARQRKALAGLDERMLRDIGITRYDAERECSKPFWR